MRKFAVILIALMLLITMTSCGKTTEPSESFTEPPSVTATTESTVVNEPSSVEISETSEPTETEPAETAPTETTPAETTPVETTTQHTHNWQPVNKTIHHDAEYKTVHHEAETHVVHHEAEYKTVYHDAEYDEVKTLVGYRVKHWVAKFRDGHIVDRYDYNYDTNAYKAAVHAYQDYLDSIGQDTGYSNGSVYHELSVDEYNRYVSLVTLDKVEELYDTTTTLVRDAWTEEVLVKDAWDETIVDKKAYDEKVLVREAYTEEVIDYYECECGERK